MAIFRAMGARPSAILGMLVLEAMLCAALGAGLGLAFVYGGLAIGRPVIDAAWGLWLPLDPPGVAELVVLSASYSHLPLPTERNGVPPAAAAS